MWGFTSLAVLTYMIDQISGSPLHPRLDAHGDLISAWERALDIGWWLLGARSAIWLLRVSIILEHRPRETQIISDLLGGCIYLATLLAVVNCVFSIPITGMLATSGIIAIVLGLALQSTLADVFSGVAVGIERPYKAGDLLWVEGGIEGHVLHVNWRSTHIATSAHDIAVIPNSVIAKARLVNHSRPSLIRSEKVEVSVDPLVMPERCTAVLLAALRACKLPLADHPTAITQIGLTGDGAVYSINFAVASSKMVDDACTELYSKVQRHLLHAGIALAVAGQATLPRLTVPNASDLLHQSDLFSTLTRHQRELVAGYLREQLLKPGDHLMSQGDIPDALYVISAGTVEITTTTPGRSHVVYRVSPGGTIGAIALITGLPYGATASALTPVKAYKLSNTGIAAAIAADPAIVGGLEAHAGNMQAALISDEGMEAVEQLGHPDMFLSRIRSFLHRVGTLTTSA